MISNVAVEKRFRPARKHSLQSLFGVPYEYRPTTFQDTLRTDLSIRNHSIFLLEFDLLAHRYQFKIADIRRKSRTVLVAKRLRPIGTLKPFWGPKSFSRINHVSAPNKHYFSTLFNLNIQENIARGRIMDHVQIRIKHFTKYIKRGDIKTPNWFAVDHNILLHPDFFGLSGDEFKVFIWVVGVAAHLNSETIRVYPEVCASQLRVSKKTVNLCIEKLKGKRWDVTDPLRECTGNIEAACTTGQDSTEEYRTVQNRGGNILGLSTEPDRHPFLKTWNETVTSLPVVIEVTDSRRKSIQAFLKKRTLEDFKDACVLVEESDFLSGRNGKWTNCCFDWVLKPANFTKIIEGNYNRDSVANDPSWKKFLAAENDGVA